MIVPPLGELNALSVQARNVSTSTILPVGFGDDVFGVVGVDEIVCDGEVSLVE